MTPKNPFLWKKASKTATVVPWSRAVAAKIIKWPTIFNILRNLMELNFYETISTLFKAHRKFNRIQQNFNAIYSFLSEFSFIDTEYWLALKRTERFFLFLSTSFAHCQRFRHLLVPVRITWLSRILICIACNYQITTR